MMAEERLRVRLRDIAERAGISKRKVLDDVHRRHLSVIKVRCGTRWMALVEPDEADRYLHELLQRD